MKRGLKIRFATLFAALVLLASAAPRGFSQEQPTLAGNVHTKYEKMDAPETAARKSNTAIQLPCNSSPG